MVLIIREPATVEQIAQMEQVFGIMIKLAVDVRRGILAGGGSLHALREQVETITRRLLEVG